MGMWGGKNPLDAGPEEIAAEMRPALYRWFTAQIMILDPLLANLSSYDALTDDVTNLPDAAKVFDSGANGAMYQPIRSPARTELGGQGSSIIGIRFQAKKLETIGAGVLRAGLLVTASGGNQSDEIGNYVFSLGDAIDSSLQWGRIMEASVMTGGAVG